MAIKINLNSDMGEGFGAYEMGHDNALIGIVKSCNVACGFHGGDWGTMHRLCELAKTNGCSIGAHPGFNDLWGFGRRVIQMRASDIELMVAYQIGALQAIAAMSGLKVTHLKPHGALSNMAATDKEYALAIGRAIKSVDRKIIYVAQAATEMVRAAENLGLKLAREGFADRQYEEDLTLASRQHHGAVIRNPAAAAEQAYLLAAEKRVVTRAGKSVPLDVDSICIHGDEPSAVPVAQAVKARLDQAGITIVPLTELTTGQPAKRARRGEKV